MLQKLDFNALAFKNGLCTDLKRNKKSRRGAVLRQRHDRELEDKLDKEIDKVVRGMN